MQEGIEILKKNILIVSKTQPNSKDIEKFENNIKELEIK
jgi:hypothetical protein